MTQYNYAIQATTNVDLAFNGATLPADAFAIPVAPAGTYTFTLLGNGGTLVLTNPPVIAVPWELKFSKVVFPVGAQVVAFHA